MAVRPGGGASGATDAAPQAGLEQAGESREVSRTEAALAARGFMPGDLKPTAVQDPPEGWLLCDGASYDRDTYADLFAAIGTTFGAGTGGNAFNVPDLRGRALVAAGDGPGLTDRPLAAGFGAENVTLVPGDMPSHNHNISNGGGHDHATFGNTVNNTTAGGSFARVTGLANSGGGGTSGRTGTVGDHNHGGNTGSSGSDNSHNNMQPSLAINVFIYAGELKAEVTPP